MEVEINGQKKVLKELKYLDAVEIQEAISDKGLREATKKFLILSGLTEEEAEGLTVAEGLKIQENLTKLSEDFQTPTEKRE